MKKYEGFTLIELVAIIIIIGTLSVSFSTRMMPSSTYQLQAARDEVVSALFIAQQKAMTQLGVVELRTSDDDDSVNLTIDGLSVRSSGTSYPLILTGGVSISDASFSYDRLGFTTSSSITLSKGSDSVTISVSGTGYAY